MIKVEGNTPSAVTGAVCNEMGIRLMGRKGRHVDRISRHVLRWWRDEKNANLMYGHPRQAKKRIVREVKQSYGMIWGFLLSWLINAVVQYVIDWLMSSESMRWRYQNT